MTNVVTFRRPAPSADTGGDAIASASYQQGYDAAYAEIYAAVDSEDRPANCGECRACGVMRTVLEDSMRRLGGKMTLEEFNTLAGILKAVNGREDGPAGH